MPPPTLPVTKGPIRGLSVHPSGKLAVSVGHDRLLKLWHLGKGRCSYTARLEAEADDVAFSADGEVRLNGAGLYAHFSVERRQLL
jgi:WD40 repeat protein